MVLSRKIISKVIHRQNCPWPGLLTIFSRVYYQRGWGGDGRMGKPSKNVWDALVNGSLAKLEDVFSKIDETFARC